MPGVDIRIGVEQGILSEVYRAMMQSTDYALDPQPDKLSRNLNVLRCFSLQETFGHQLERSHRNLTSKVAKTTMDFRLATLIFAFTFITEIKGAGGQVIENDFTKPGKVFSSSLVERSKDKFILTVKRCPPVIIWNNQMVH